MTLPDLSKVTAILPDLADYIVYGAIAIVTLIGVFKCLLPLWNTSAALRRAAEVFHRGSRHLNTPISVTMAIAP